MNTRRFVVSSAAVLAIAAGSSVVLGSTPGSASSTIPVVNCLSMPDLWSGATEVGYRADVNRVTFTWPLPGEVEGTPLTLEVEISADDPGCDAQPGLAKFLRDLVQGERESALQSCLDLKELVSILRAANPGASGEVAVPPDADGQVLAARHPEQLIGADGEQFAAALRERNQRVPRTLDLAKADAEIAAGCAS